MNFDNLFANYLKNETLLMSYGFIKNNKSLIYSKKIINNKFLVKVTITNNLKVDVLDLALNDLFLPFYNSIKGSFSSEITKEVENILIDIRNNCYSKDYFKSKQAKAIISYIKETYHNDPEYLWEDNNAIFRNSKNNKWYLALITTKGENFDKEGEVEIIDLKGDPDNIPKIIDNKNIFPGYHMNKKHWFTIILDGSMNFNEICKYIDESYNIVNS